VDVLRLRKPQGGFRVPRALVLPQTSADGSLVGNSISSLARNADEAPTKRLSTSEKAS
jgi:hypothetical protein